MEREEAVKLLKRKKIAREYADYCVSVDCCNGDPDVGLLYEPQSYWDEVEVVSSKKGY